MITPWHDSQLQLKYQLSDYTFAVKTFHVRQCEVGINRDMKTPLLNTDRDSEYDGFSVRGLPIKKKGRLITTDPDFFIYRTTQNYRYYIDFKGSFTEYLEKFSSKTLSTLKRKVKKCNAKTTFRVYKSVDELLEFHRLARIVSMTSYQESLLKSGIPNDDKFINQLKQHGQEGSARGFLLFDDETPVSYLYLTIKNGILIYQYLGYNPLYMKLSVGTVLHWHAIESLFNENKFNLLDFTEGEGTQKKSFSTGNVLCCNTLFLNKNIKNFVFILGHVITNYLSSLLGDIFTKLKFKQKIKKIIRFGVHQNEK